MADFESKLQMDWKSIKTIRTLSVELVSNAHSGDFKTAVAMAPLVHILWSRHLRFNPKNPKWINRDRFVLSNSDASILNYVMLFLCGFDNLSLEGDLKRFRKFGSRTSEHPYCTKLEGVEITTGPSGQGLCNAIGMHMARLKAEALFENSKLISNRTIVLCSHADLVEGVSSEGFSLTTGLDLKKGLVVFCDDNGIIDGAFSQENFDAIYREGYGWNTLKIENLEDLDEIEQVLNTAIERSADNCVLVRVRRTNGCLSEFLGTNGDSELVDWKKLLLLKQKLGFDPNSRFEIPDEVLHFWRNQVAVKGQLMEEEWRQKYEREFELLFPEKAQLLHRLMSGVLPMLEWSGLLIDLIDQEKGYDEELEAQENGITEESTSSMSSRVICRITEKLPEIIGGYASGISKWNLSNSKRDDRNIHFGSREHAMFAICNGIRAYGFYIPFSSTSLNYITYGWPALRLAALSNLQHLIIITDDSIGIGEDGAAYQGVEVLALIRSTPNITEYRPADYIEVIASYVFAIERNLFGPTVLCLTRQPVCNRLEDVVLSASGGIEDIAERHCYLNQNRLQDALMGAYVLFDSFPSKKCTETLNFDVILISTGSEVQLSLLAAVALSTAPQNQLAVRVISAPSLSLFDQQPLSYRKNILPLGCPVVSIEAMNLGTWGKYAHYSISLPSWCASGSSKVLFEKFGFTAEAVVQNIREFLDRISGISIGPLSTHLQI